LAFFFIHAFEGSAQENESRFSITPHFGLGMLLPGHQTTISGNERMIYRWSFYSFGSLLNANGERTFNAKTTNRVGLDLNYKLHEKFQLSVGANRISILSSYRPSYVYSFQGQRINGLVSDFNYFNYDFGFRFSGYNLFYVLKGNYLPNVNSTFKKRASSATIGDPGVFTNSSNTGLIFTTVQSNDIKYGLYAGIGQSLLMGDGNTELEIGISFTNNPFYKEEVRFLENGNQIGSVRTNHLINTIFVSLNQSLVFRKKKKLPKIKSPKIKPEKIKEHKPSVQVGMSKVVLGEGLVLHGLQFEQSSSELSPENEADLKDVLAFLIAYPKSRIEISGHTSAEGDRIANIELSEKRAVACKTYFERNGVASKRIKTLGRGPDRPISKIEPEKNRRVEMKILSLD
jgi:outer membrane protein OmpA-like peptidoglycan-associated protein